jgi:hypothetical protein
MTVEMPLVNSTLYRCCELAREIEERETDHTMLISASVSAIRPTFLEPVLQVLEIPPESPATRTQREPDHT